jgi:hypothetical protein
MTKHRILIPAIVLSVICIIAPEVQGKTGVSSQRSSRPPGHLDFVGEVLGVDTAAQNMTLRSGRNTVTFDISNPVLQGYGSVAAIKKGDRVGVGYTAVGINIAKSPRITEGSAQGKAGLDKSGPEKSVATPSRVQTPKKTLRIARRTKTDGKSFSGVDNNKDGKISPIELCVVIPNLTTEQFRQYDKNHDGYLDRAEFGQIKLP